MSRLDELWNMAEALNNQNAQASGDFKKENIWFKWGDKDEHIVRLVGDPILALTHWIGESQFGKDIAILEKSAFKGEGKLPLNVACTNWVVEQEISDPSRGCPVCRLGKNADQFLRENTKELNEADKAVLKSIRRKCNPRKVFMVKCIDRDDPYIDDDKTIKGYKILKMSQELFGAIYALIKELDGIDIFSEDGGCDIKISRKKNTSGGGASVKYSAFAVLKGGAVSKSPMTDEERSYKERELVKFIGKPIDAARFEEELSVNNNIRELYNLSEMDDITDGPQIGDGDVPF